MKIVYIHKAVFQKRPPVVSVVMILQQLGHDVTVVTQGVSDEWKEKLETLGIQYHVVEGGGSGVLGKIRDYTRFRKQTFAYLKEEFSPKDTLLWIESASTMVALGTGIKQFKYILQIQELHNEHKYQLRSIGKIIHEAEAVFMPEYNRCTFYQIWFKLKKRPYVLPNKPYFDPTEEEMKVLEQKYADTIALIKEKKSILYEGFIGGERELTAYVKAVSELGDDFRLVMLGRDFGLVDEFKKICPTMLHIPFMPAPDFLSVVSKAYIGIVAYDPMLLNTAYCAPNKIFSYSHYGLPMIGNEIPGLKYTVEISGAGLLVNEKDVEAIKNAILTIDKNYDEFSANAHKMYNSVDNAETIKQVLETIKL